MDWYYIEIQSFFFSWRVRDYKLILDSFHKTHHTEQSQKHGDIRIKDSLIADQATRFYRWFRISIQNNEKIREWYIWSYIFPNLS